MSRWKIHKLGFINFWLYDREEFRVEDGHFLLRGQNGAGKSITTQSFIPFVLDGNMRPERLDPFGTRDKKMDFYLLGDGEREESTGYLYLEFRKPDVERYLTIGIGLRAQKGKPIDFWGFCLRDGRRVGSGGLELFERVGAQMIPITKQKLRNLIGSKDDFADSQQKYKQMVNDRIFGFRDIKQYDQLVSLLIKVRTPKLSKDSFRPTELKRILNDSLQVLTDEDLSAMVSTMERMDDLEDTLKGYRDAVRDTEIILREYGRYNRYMLGMKGRAWLDGLGTATKCRRTMEETERVLQEAEGNLEEQVRVAEDARLRQEQAAARQAALGEDDLSAKRMQMTEKENNGRELEGQIDQGNRTLAGLRDRIRDGETKLRGQEQEAQDIRLSIRLASGRLEKENGQVRMEEEHVRLTEQLSQRVEEAEISPVRAAAQRRREQIDVVLRVLWKLEDATRAYEQACKEYDQASTALTEAQSRQRDAAEQEQRERDTLLETFLRRQSECQELLFPEEEVQAIRRDITLYRSSADWGAIRERIDNCYQACLRDRTREQLQAVNRLEEQIKAVRETKKELDQIRRQPDPVPPRRPQTEAARQELIRRKIPHAALYEVVDFARDLEQEKRDLLEAQLRDTGLLDALIVPRSSWDDVQDLLVLYPDRFLVPSGPAKDPLTDLIPAGDPAFRFMTSACLRSISRSDLKADTAILPDGRYRIGVIQGRSKAEGPASYIGAAARRAARERMIRELQEKLAALEQVREELEREVEALKNRLIRLGAERDQMPNAIALDRALEKLREETRALTEAEVRLEDCREKERQAKQTEARLQQDVRDRSVGLPYGRTVEEYEIARDAVGTYLELLNSMEKDLLALNYTLSAMEVTETAILQDRDQADSQKKLCERYAQQLEVVKEGIRALQEYLDRPENRARAEELKELANEIRTQRDREVEAEKQKSSLETEIRNRQERLESDRASLEKASQEEQTLRQYFQEELGLGFVESDPAATLEQTARDAFNRVPAMDRNRTAEQLGETLLKSFQDHNTNLMHYHPRSGLCFDAPAKMGQLRQRQVITLQRDGRDLSLYDFLDMMKSLVAEHEVLLEQSDRELFENILTETVSHKLRSRIEESQQWTRNMTALMATLSTSMGLTFRLEWRPKKAESEEEMDTAQLVTLLNKDKALLRPEDSAMVSNHFRQKVRTARQRALESGDPINYGDLIRGTLDYRTWYEFRLSYQRSGEVWKELTDRVFNRFSGGEKAMTMYVPLFASVSAQYQKGGEECPLLLALDEAFAGVDDRNIGAMFELVGTLDFDYVMNSQALWGCYDSVHSLDIAELHRPANASVVTILRYHWDGVRRRMLEDESAVALTETDDESGQ